MNLHDTLGFLAAALTTGSFVPQALLTLRTRDVRGISLAMYSRDAGAVGYHPGCQDRRGPQAAWSAAMLSAQNL